MMTNLIKKNPVLLVVDIQKGFYDEDYWGGNISNKNVETICGNLINKWRELHLKLIHLKHSSTDLNSKLHISNKGHEFCDLTKPIKDEIVITKNVNSAFIGTNLKEILDKNKHEVVVIIGLTTDHCISTTARMSGNYGYETYVVSDATATFDKKSPTGEFYSSELVHSISLLSLDNEFAKVINYENLIKKL